MYEHTRGNRMILLRIIGTWLVLVVVAGCAGSPQPATVIPSAATGESSQLTSVSMRLQWIPQYQFAGYIVAKVKGYYEEEGLDVTLNPGSPDFVPLPLVVSGADTFGSTGADTIFLAHERGIEVVALATIFQTSPVAFMVHSDAGISHPQDFVGHTVGVSYGDNVETEYRALLAATDVNRSQIDEVPMQFNLEPFLSRRVDVWPVYATDQPDLAREQGAEVDLITARDYGVVLMGDVLFTTKDYVEQNPGITRAFVHATLRGWEYALTNVDETVQLIADYNEQLSLEHLRFEAQETQKLVQYGAGEHCPGWNDRQRWLAERDLLLELDLLSSAIPYEQAVENRFVAAYYQQQEMQCQQPGMVE